MTALEDPRSAAPAHDRDALLSVEDLRVTFHTLEGTLRVLNGVNLTVRPGESVGLVGETGCGKSVTLRSILGLLPTPPARISGRILFRGRDLVAMGDRERRRLRGREMSFIPQEAQGSLNPVFTVGEQLIELIRWQGSEDLPPLRYLRGRYDAASRCARTRAVEMLGKVQIPDPERILRAYPVQLSGGMAQRVLIAMALAGRPSILMADEPGTALDVTTQHAILALLRTRIREEGLSLLYVTHNLGVAREMTERVYVMYGGDIVEVAPTDELFSRPEHPYTQALVESVPHLTGEPLRGIEGMIPDYSDPPSGCRYHPRCPYVMPICYPEKPRLVEVGEQHRVLCTLHNEEAGAAFVREERGEAPGRRSGADHDRAVPWPTEAPLVEALRAVRHPSDDWPTDGSLLTVRDLVKHYPVTAGLLGRPVATVRAADGVSFRVAEGQTFALVGESGSGKTTVGKAVIRLLRPTSGLIRFDGRDIAQLEGESLQRLRPQMQMVFQDAASSLNPRRRIADIIRAPLAIHRWGTAEQKSERVRKLLSLVELPERYLHDYPHALSGGQKQRVAIARALALNPRLIVLDEPTSALDVSVQAKILKLLEEIQDRLQLTYLLITHDLGVVRHVADHVAVMYLGHIVETAPTGRLFAAPAHPYTRSLLASIPVVSAEETALLPPRRPLVGEIPSPTRIPAGCPFHTRCPNRMDVCQTKPPPWVRLGPGHYVWCHLYPEPAGKALGAPGEEDVETPGWLVGHQSPPGGTSPEQAAMTEPKDEEAK